MNLAGFYEESISNGLGLRAVVFVSGCPHKCYNCHNEEAQDFDYGVKFNKNIILESISHNTVIKGVTISGGEPLCEENIADVLNLILDIKQLNSNLDIWCYSGYTLESLLNRNDNITNECLKNIDILVDGRYEEKMRNPLLKFRGSDNQRLLDMRQTFKQNKVVELNI